MHTHAQVRSLTPHAPFHPITTLFWEIQYIQKRVVQAQWLGPGKKGS